MIRIIDLLALSAIVLVALCAGVSIGAHGMEAKDFGCRSYSQTAVTHAIDVLLPRPGEVHSVNGDER